MDDLFDFISGTTTDDSQSEDDQIPTNGNQNDGEIDRILLDLFP